MKALIKSLLFAVMWTGASAGALSSIWDGAEDTGNGWYHLDWFGSFNELSPEWIYHSEHGFLMVTGVDTSDFSFYDIGLGSWFSTGDAYYPILYKLGYREGWYWHESGGTPGSRSFTDLMTGEVLGESSLMEIVLPTYALIEQGTFTMGSEMNATWQEGMDRATLHDVTLSAYHIQHTLVTNAQYAHVMNWAYGDGLLTLEDSMVKNAEGDPRSLYHVEWSGQVKWSGQSFVVDAGKGSYPVVGVTWYGGMAYCHFLTRMEGTLTQAVNLADWTMDISQTGYRLPTEAEWERAARGGRSGEIRFPWENWWITHDDANYYATPTGYTNDKSETYREHPDWYSETPPSTSPVGSFPANEFGLYDMAGNAFDWCYDWYDFFYYAESPPENPTGPETGTDKILRGGSWDLNSQYARLFNRHVDIPEQIFLSRNGFRAVRTAAE